MRVVFVLDHMEMGGTELNAIRTAERLDRARFDLRVVCLRDGGPLAERYRAAGIPVVTMPVRSLYGTSMIGSGLRFARYLREEQIDIVHAHDMYSNVFAAPWAKLARRALVIVSRRWWHTLPNRKLRMGNMLAFRMAHRVLTNSRQVAASVRSADHVGPERIWVVSNFADEGAFDPLAVDTENRLRREIGIEGDGPVIGCVARLHPVKDHESLLRAFALLRLLHPSARLVLVGDGEMSATLRSAAQTLGVSDAVIFAGERRDRVNFHRLFDVSVLCSLSEGFPNTIVEAMAAGKPVVATAVGGNIDAVADGETGLLVPVQDPGQLSQALDTLLKDETLRRRLGDAGQQRARANYRAVDVLASLEALYQTLLAARAA